MMSIPNCRMCQCYYFCTCLISIIEIVLVVTGEPEKISPAWKCYPILWLLRQEINQKLDAEYTELEALMCEKQLVAGTKYEILVRYFQSIFFI